MANGNTITGGINGELFIPFCDPFACRQETFVLLALYTWTATDFTPRMVSLNTSNTTHFILFDRGSGGVIELYPDEFTPGSGFINVVPAPAAWLIAGLIFVSGTRRRSGVTS